jgi:HAD superfamily hydrolase (TIGR01490 family)
MKLALFDLDNTLLNGDSDHAWGEFLASEGIVDRHEHRRSNDVFFAQYKDGTLDINAYLEFALSAIAGKTPEELAPLHQRFMVQKIAPMISPEARALVQQHVNDTLAIVTATNSFVTAPIAAEFGVDTLIACDVEILAGRYTGKSIGVPSFREGKIVRVEMWLATLGKTLDDFDESWFYSDSQNDLPLLARVSHPVAVNPDPILRAHALQHAWPIIELASSAVPT